MFGIGFFELIIIAVVALIFVGPQRLPEVMKQAGRLFVQFRRTANDVRSTFDEVVRQAEDEIRREEAEAMKALLVSKTTQTVATTVTTPPITTPDEKDHPLPADANGAQPHTTPVASTPAAPAVAWETASESPKTSDLSDQASQEAGQNPMTSDKNS